MPTCKRLAELQRTARKSLIAAVLTAVSVSGRAAAQTDSLGCETPSNLQPLMVLLDSLTQLAFLGGIGLATLGFTIAGIFIILPGEDNTRRGKMTAKNVLIGSIILLSAHMIVSFLVSQLGGVICTEAAVNATVN